MMVMETLFTIIVSGETGRWRKSEQRFCAATLLQKPL